MTSEPARDAKEYTAKVYRGFIVLFDLDGNVLKNGRGKIRRWPFYGDEAVGEAVDQAMSLDPSKANYLDLPHGALIDGSQEDRTDG